MKRTAVAISAVLGAAAVIGLQAPSALATVQAPPCPGGSGVCVFYNYIGDSSNADGNVGGTYPKYSNYYYYGTSTSIHDSVSGIINYESCNEDFFINTYYTSPSGKTPFLLYAGYEASNLSGTGYNDDLDSNECAS